MSERVHICYCSNRGDNYHTSGAPGCITEKRDAEPTERDVEELATSIAGCFSNVSDLPTWMRVPALGQTMRPLTLIAARAVLASGWYAERIAEVRRDALTEAADAADSTGDAEQGPVYVASDWLRKRALRGDA